MCACVHGGVCVCAWRCVCVCMDVEGRVCVCMHKEHPTLLPKKVCPLSRTSEHDHIFREHHAFMQ
jgi:hypothetical protein